MDADDFGLNIGHRFDDPELLRRALTHRSHGAVHNERLEYLGDSVLNCVIAVELFHKYPQLTEGELSRLRASLVNQQTLSTVAQQFEHFLAVRRLAGDAQVDVFGQELAQPRPHDGMVIDDHDTDHGSGSLLEDAASVEDLPA